MLALFHGEMTSDEDAHTLNSYIVPTMFLTLFFLPLLLQMKRAAGRITEQWKSRASEKKKKKKKEAHEQSKSVLENQI